MEPGQWGKAKQLIEQELRFAVVERVPGQSELRTAIQRAGSRRLAHCVEVVKLQGNALPGDWKYRRLMHLLAEITPAKRIGTKYRNSYSGAGMVANRTLDREWLERVERDG